MLRRRLHHLQHRLRGGADDGERVCVGRVEQVELFAGVAVRQRRIDRLYSFSAAARGQERVRMSQIVENPAGLLAALDRGESLPARWYTDPAITEQEILRVFRKAWNYIGPLGELKSLGDYITGYAGGVPMVVIRNEAGLAGFVNVCRHRRHEVMKGRGNAKVMQCGYHAWTYDLAGCLKGAPRSAGEPNFRLENFPLLPLRVEALGPFVFVNFDPDAAPLHSYFGPVLDIIAGSGVDLD